jgi:hypothetical protein
MESKISIRNARNAKTGLKDMINHIGNNNIVMAELGCYVGDSTEIFAENFVTVYAIDPWLNGYDDNDDASHMRSMTIVEAQFDECICGNFDNVHKIKMRSDEAVKKFDDESIDFVYIDALHTYSGVKKDIELWFPKIRKTGYIGGHDYQGRFQGVIDAVNEFKKPDKIFKDTSWIIKI